MKLIRKEKGITLIALVITIVVLIILAGVTISVCSGEDGLITKAVEGKKEMTKESIKEAVQICKVDDEINNSDETFEQFKTKVTEKLTDGKLINSNTKIIGGYIVLDKDNIISMYTGENAVIGDSTEWIYDIYTGNDPDYCYTASITTGENDTFVTTVDHTIVEQANESNKVARITGYKGSATSITIPEIIIDNDEIIPVTRLGDYWGAGQNFTTVNVSHINILKISQQ